MLHKKKWRPLITVSKTVEALSRNHRLNITQNEHVYAIWCRPEVAGDVISGANVKTIEGSAVLNVEVASFSSFHDIKQEAHHQVGLGETRAD